MSKLYSKKEINKLFYLLIPFALLLLILFLMYLRIIDDRILTAYIIALLLLIPLIFRKSLGKFLKK